MAYLLFTIALALIVASGLGILALVFRRQFASFGELLGFATLAGLIETSLLVFILSLIGSSGLILTATSAVAIILGIVGIRKFGKRVKASDPRSRRAGWGLVAVMLIHVVLTLAIVHRRGIGWDGVFVWDMKARAFFVNNGSAPIGYFSDPTRQWSHQNYPLMVPMTELWTYLWIGEAHQSFGKYLILIFYFPVVPLLFESARRLGGNIGSGFVASLLPLAIPMLILEEGAATSGYADFPIAAFYFAAVVALLRMIEERSSQWALMAGIFGAGVAFTKQEGQILFIALSLIALLAVRGVRLPWHVVLRIWIPGATVLLGWRGFLKWTEAWNGGAYLPVTWSRFVDNLDRTVPILRELCREFIALQRWSILWLAFAIAWVWLFRLHGVTKTSVLIGSVLLPLPAYVFVYLFSAWNPYMNHVLGSLPRLLVQLALPAILGIALVAWPRRELSTSPQD